MFYPHSLLWHYLWVAPSILLLCLAVILYRRSLNRELPAFFRFVVFEGVTVLALYVLDVKPSLSSDLFYWQVNFVRLLIEVVLKFALIGEIFWLVFRAYPALSKLGKGMIRGFGGVLVLAAIVAAALARASNFHPLITADHLLNLGDFIIECGLLAFIFSFAAYFGLVWDRLAYGIALGRGLAASVQLTTWALMSNLAFTTHQRQQMDFVNMGVYHLSVLIWLYYVLTTPKESLMEKLGEEGGRDLSGADLSGEDSSGEDDRQHDLVVLNREVERLLQR